MVATASQIEPEKLLVSPREAARLLSICEKTLWTITKRDGVPCVRIGRAVRYSPADLRSWIERSTAQSKLLP